jgi:argininosuccinate lyase
MPQKKNPIVLEVTKGKAAHVYGALVSALASMKNTSFSLVIDVSRESLHYLDDAVKETKATLELLGDGIRWMEIHKEGALQKCRENFSTVTDLADALVRRGMLSFREAHTVVGAVVREAMERGLTSNMVTADILEDVARRIVGKKVQVTNDDVIEALDPEKAVGRRTLTGGPAAEQTHGMIEAGLKDIEQKTHQVGEQERILSDADRKLKEAANKFP